MAGLGERFRSAISTLMGTAAPAAPAPSPRDNGDPAYTQFPSTTLNRQTVALIRCALEEHEQGQFNQTARMAVLMCRDADVQQALAQRVLGLLGLPFAVKSADDTPAAEAEAKEATSLFPRVVPSASSSDALRAAIQLGFFIGQLVWTWDEDLGELVPRLDPWAPEYCEYMAIEDRWYVYAQEGRIPITPGDGRWVLWTPNSSRWSYQYGAVRALLLWVLRADDTARDAARFSEVMGQGVWLAKGPANFENTVEGKRWLNTVRNMGRAGIVPLPQGDSVDKSFDLELEQADSQGWKGFEFLLSLSGRKIRMAVLGQDMTSQSGPEGGSYAQSKVGNGVREDIRLADAVGWSEVVYEQIMRPWWKYRGRKLPPPRPGWNATPAEDLASAAKALSDAGDALTKWDNAGWDVDREAYAKRFHVPGKLGEKKPPPPALPPPAPGQPPTPPPAPGKKAARAPSSPLAAAAAGQTYVDDVADNALALGGKAMDPVVARVLAAVAAADGYEDLRRRLLDVFPGMEPAKLRELVYGATLLGEAAGTFSARKEIG